MSGTDPAYGPISLRASRATKRCAAICLRTCYAIPRAWWYQGVVYETLELSDIKVLQSAITYAYHSTDAGTILCISSYGRVRIMLAVRCARTMLQTQVYWCAYHATTAGTDERGVYGTRGTLPAVQSTSSPTI
eukprot:3179471-Rhodomonas_salina.1